MAAILAGDIRKGTTFEYNGKGVYTVTDFQHVKPGKGAAFVRATLKNVVTGQVLSDVTFNPSTKLETAQVETKKMTYSYTDGDFYYFMDPDTFEMITLSLDQVQDALKYIRENDIVSVKSLNGTPFSVDPDNFVELKVTECEPGVRGNTATNATKYATVETGAQLLVPMFINEGEIIRIDTRTGEYMARVNK
ncbi:MAG: elongation factor P [Clostridia bacterium]|nr:elongation factor P [Clostridia bacterium]MCD8295029.1 elongation factor P [Clostridia bacterium]